MKRRTTLEIDEELLARTARALGCTTKRETVEEALRLALANAEDEADQRRKLQASYLGRLGSMIDRDVLESESMWR